MVPFNDLTTQWAPHKARIFEEWSALVDQSRFVGGDPVELAELKLRERFSSDDKSFNHAILCSSGTAALTIILKALDFPEGSYIGIQANTFYATAFSVIHAGHQPVLIDSWDAVDEAHRKHDLRCVIPVHMYGCVNTDDMQVLQDYCALKGIVIVEDACQSIGAATNGSWGVASAVSFYPGKNLGCWGQAGAIVTDYDKINDYARAYIQQGYVDGKPTIVGDNLRCDTLQAVVIDKGLDSIFIWNALRKVTADFYLNVISDLKNVAVPEYLTKSYPNSWHLFPVYMRNMREADLRDLLKERGIATGRHYQTQLSQTPYGHKWPKYPLSGWHSHISGRAISLPIFPSMTREQRLEVGDALIEADQTLARKEL